MAGLNFVKSVRERMTMLSCLAIVGSASMSLLSQADAQTATATASAQFAVTSSGWTAGTHVVNDVGGNYSTVNNAPPGITVTYPRYFRPPGELVSWG